jgi:pilus assembly protein CpaB
VRVLAIDQAPKEKDGETTVLGKTVTLELKPEQAETLARARQAGSLSLALRSLVDANVADTGTESEDAKRGSSIDIVRHGIATSQAARK